MQATLHDEVLDGNTWFPICFNLFFVFIHSSHSSFIQCPVCSNLWHCHLIGLGLPSGASKRNRYVISLSKLIPVLFGFLPFSYISDLKELKDLEKKGKNNLEIVYCSNLNLIEVKNTYMNIIFAS